MAELLVLLPWVFAGVTFAVPSNRWRPYWLPVGGLAHLALTVRALQAAEVSGLSGWLQLDPLGKLVLGLVSVLFLLCAAYAPGYLAQRPERNNRVLCACLLLSLGMMTLIVLSHHLGLMWVAMEATTLVSAPGLYFNHNARSLEATWKYLLICSVGIALALLGSLFLAYSAVHAGLESTLLLDDVIRQAPQLSPPWLRAAFVLLLVGYGTKMGLAPMHTWKPDAYGEAPGMIGALLAANSPPDQTCPCRNAADSNVNSLTNGANGGEPVIARKPVRNNAPDTGRRRRTPRISAVCLVAYARWMLPADRNSIPLVSPLLIMCNSAAQLATPPRPIPRTRMPMCSTLE